MIKVITMLKRIPPMTLEQFRTWMTQEHPKISMKVPGVRHYRVNVAEEDNPDNPFDVVVELYFDSQEAFKAAYETPEGKAAVADAMPKVSARARMIVKETVLIK